MTTPSIIPFVFKDEHTVRTFTENNIDWFCAQDICKILGYTRTSDAVRKNCTSKGTSIRRTLTEGGEQKMIYINQPNLFRLISRSRKPEAEKFEEWIFEVVLPEIAKTGQYGAEKAIEQNERVRNLLHEDMMLEQRYNSLQVIIEDAKDEQRAVRVRQAELKMEMYGQYALPFNKNWPQHIGPGWKHK